MLRLFDFGLCGCRQIRADKLSTKKSGGCGIYFKETLAVRQVAIKYLSECLLLIVLYWK